MLKRPPARDLIRDIFPVDANNWSEALGFWSLHIKDSLHGKAFILGDNITGMALWGALSGMDVYINSDPNKFQIFDTHAVQESIFRIDSSSRLFDVVVLLVQSQSKQKMEEDLKLSLARVKTGGVLLVGASSHKTDIGHFFGLRQDRLKTDESPATKTNRVLVKHYGIFSTTSKIKYLRQLAVLFNKLLQNVTPSSWKYMQFIVFRK